MHVQLAPVAFGERGEGGLVARDRGGDDLVGSIRLHVVTLASGTNLYCHAPGFVFPTS